jgi:cellulose synthase (UDP-forming)
MAPALIFSWIIYPLWHRSHHGIEAWAAREAFAWAHLFAVIDLLRRKRLDWQPTGIGTDKSKQYKNFKIAVFVFNFVPGLAWVIASIWREFTWNYWSFIPLLAVGIFYLISISMIVFYRPVAIFESIDSAGLNDNFSEGGVSLVLLKAQYLG